MYLHHPRGHRKSADTDWNRFQEVGDLWEVLVEMNAREELLAIPSKCSSLRDIRKIIRLVGEQEIGDDTGHGQFSTNQLRWQGGRLIREGEESVRQIDGDLLGCACPDDVFQLLDFGRDDALQMENIALTEERREGFTPDFMVVIIRGQTHSTGEAKTS